EILFLALSTKKVEQQVEQLLQLVQTITDISTISISLSIITSGANGPDGTLTSPLENSLLGFLKAIRLEHPELHAHYIDLDPGDNDSQQIKSLMNTLVFQKHSSGKNEGTVIRDGMYYHPTLERAPDSLIEPIRSTNKQIFNIQKGDRPGLEHIQLKQSDRREPLPHEIEICITAAGVNFIDVLDVLGILPFERNWLGVECSGVISRVGSEVSHFKAGDTVMALAPGSFCSYVTVDHRWAVLKPATITPLVCASIPAAFLTAQECLIHAAQLKKGERILIHAATGGTGMAAVRTALAAGADVYATARPAKWTVLRVMGVQHLMNSRDLDFKQQIIEAGGVDVVLNSLSGNFIQASIDCLRPGGRFIEIGKRDIWTAEQMAKHRSDVQYQIIDLMTIAKDHPEKIQTSLLQLKSEFESEKLKPNPIESFPITQTDKALRRMQNSEHIGKLVLTIENQAATVRNEGCYIITGGLGGLGQLTAKWLASKGASHILLLTRRNNQNNFDLQWADQYSDLNVEILTLDVSDKQALEKLFKRLENSATHVRGIFHAAGVLSDALIQKLTVSNLNEVLAPKLRGAQYLDHFSKTLTRPLDWFVLYSSAASLFGSPGQASHVSANSYLDSLARYRRQQGLPGLSINWGLWSEVGTVHDAQSQQKMLDQGIDSLSPEEGINVLSSLLHGSIDAQLGVVKVRWKDFNTMLTD
ncbi:MAG: SDR family NAD(P)-dependent oxidoreductase, partial [Pseudomonadota bacterium]